MTFRQHVTNLARDRDIVMVSGLDFEFIKDLNEVLEFMHPRSYNYWGMRDFMAGVAMAYEAEWVEEEFDRLWTDYAVAYGIYFNRRKELELI